MKEQHLEYHRRGRGGGRWARRTVGARCLIRHEGFCRFRAGRPGFWLPFNPNMYNHIMCSAIQEDLMTLLHLKKQKTKKNRNHFLL